VGEHKKEVEAKDTSRFTRQSKKSAEKQQNKSAITDHAIRDKMPRYRREDRAMGALKKIASPWLRPQLISPTF